MPAIVVECPRRCRLPVVMAASMTSDGFPQVTPRSRMSLRMKIHLASSLGALRRPGLQDAGLAVLLLGGTWAVRDATTTGASTGLFADAVWLREPLFQWALIAMGVGAVALRRKCPIPALTAATLAAVVQMGLAAAPVPADLAVPVVLYTIAAHRSVKTSLAMLGGALALLAAWSVYAALDGRTDGWIHPLFGGTGGNELGQDPSPGPTDWGGIPVLGSLLVLAWAIGWGVRSRRAYLNELKERARALELERDQRAALAAAAERARITRELHDVVAHGLAVIVMQAQGGTAAFAKRPGETLAALDTIVATGRASLADLRQVLSATGGTDDPDPPVPALAQLPRLIERVRDAGTPVVLQVEGSPRPLPGGVDASSYRIIQEALTNIMKHAGPGARAQVVVSYDAGALRVDVSDDGVGAADASGTGSGLRGMRERATLLGGEATAGPGPDGGYVVRVRIPLEATPLEEMA